MQHTEKSKKAAIDISNCDAFEENQLSIKLPYHDESLEKLKLCNRELTLQNNLLKEKLEELLKENS